MFLIHLSRNIHLFNYHESVKIEWSIKLKQDLRWENMINIQQITEGLDGVFNLFSFNIEVV